jgi:ankyrin repeat protein
MDKENAPNGKGNAINKEEEDRQRKIQEWEAQQEKIRREEEQRKEMERRVKEEQERQLAEQRQREAERRRLELEQQARDREAKERQLQEMRRQAELDRQRQEQERQEKIRLQEEARQRKIKEMDDAKKVRAFLQANGFKDVNDLVRKKFNKVTPLCFAVGQNDVDMVKLLLAAGADAKKMNGKKEMPLSLARKLNKDGTHAAVIQELTPATVS